MLVPDLNATDDWRKKLALFDDSGIKASLFEQLEQMATDEQRSLGLDIADFLLMEDTPQMILARMIQRNPALQTFIDTFGLELVDAEKME